ncbi:hypothetical protein A2737_03150 [Candidatus Nomurabacteria bacterium RIFCSPHIGHO2_01_FULL_41_71]|nr:MAG: hypothetical protein A2737_03150 [Candidatus Nomurabacteria bacterium RIFCSPHIGHO2_01_FULL_41_71]OGI89048.1 MAG: hypothetical protein A3B01_00525 [Candidatus Nomurabacteria bacterium RIFCSPLOWO2_01_FULL_41_52b]
MLEFIRVCDIWKSFWQALEEEVVALGGRPEMLERLAKRDVQPAIRYLARILVDMASPCPKVLDGKPVVDFDVKRAQGVWKSAVLWENGQVPFCTFTFQNVQNSTRVIVGIWHGADGVQIQNIDLVTLDCPALNQGRNQPHQHLAHLAVKSQVIDGVIYHADKGYVEFALTRIPGMNFRRLIIYDGGKVMFTEW